ncbi:MAG: SH3 domain-containing protein, partial [Kiloniellales bacterium]
KEEDDFQLRWALAFLRATGSLDLDVMDASYVALQPIEVFERPSRDAPPVDSLARGVTVKVVGRIRGRNWFLVDRGDTRLAYVRAAHLAPTASAQ